MAVLSTDMSKAFDSLCHTLVIKKLDAYGFGSRSLHLIRSFLDERYNRVKLDNISSEWKSMLRGCPQGSSFGPLLWNLFQNDMSFLVKESNLTMYADDHQLYSAGTKYNTVMSNLSTQGKLAMSWYRDNFLLANSDKFQCLSINPRNIDRENQDTVLHIGDEGITSTPFIKLLGVEIDGNFDFTSHISNICTKTSQKVGVLMRLRNLIPNKAKLIIYKSSILPHLTYCHLVWHFCRASDSRKIERIQERALRAVFKSFSEPYEELLKKAKLSSLLNRRLHDIAVLIYKVKNGLAPSIINEIFIQTNTRYSLRNNDFRIPRFDTVSYGKHTIRYLGPYIWSKLNVDLRSSPSINSFKMKIRKLDLSKILENNINCCKLCSS